MARSHPIFGWPLLLVVSLAAVSPGVLAPGAVEAPRAIRVVVDDAYAPFSFLSHEGTLQGVLIDQWQAWEKATGIKVEIHAMEWGEALRRMRAGEFDVIDSIVETPQRREQFDFTPPYAAIEASIYFRSDIAGITDVASLRGFPVGVKAGDQHIDRLNADGVTTAILFPSNDAIIEAAKQHKINTFLADDPSALYLLNKMGIDADFRHSAPIFRDELRRAVRNGDAALLRTVSQGFAAIPPAALKRIDEKWFGRTINRFGQYLTYAGYGAAVAMVLITGLAGWNRALRRGILQRTSALAESEARSRQQLEDIRLGELALRSSEKRWHSVFENSTIGIVLAEPGGNIVDANRAFQELLGYTIQELKSLSWAEITHEADLRRSAEVVQQLVSGSKGEVQIEKRYRHKDGRFIWVRATGTPIPADDGSMRYMLGLVEDVTDRKLAEHELDASIGQLRALAGRLMHTQDDERRRIAQMLHETTAQDLAALKMHLARLVRTAFYLKDGDRRALTESVSLAEQSITEIRTLSYLLHPPFLDEAGLLAALRWYASGFAERSGIIVDLDLPEHFERLPLDTETALFRIVQESLINIHRHAGSETAHIRLQRDAEELVLEIEDRGHGIPSTSLKHIMSGGGGAGVGITGMCERIEQLGGRLELTSVDGVTTVCARLPLDREVL